MELKKKTERIIELAGEKSENKRLSVLAAINLMKNDRKDINFTSVAKQADVSRNYLYKKEELRGLIESLRMEKIKKIQSKDAKDIIIETQKRKIKELEKKSKVLDDYDKLLAKYNQLLKDKVELEKQLKRAYKY